ncbi:polyketide cyclase [Pseudoalteromonas sp. NEC-BIFX-2020_002]|uniref:ester cyclase n=1 Tax=unclassified Pseudoalteromonas TaxID=194690 RepID=UPI00146161C1|nr:MULTISPECIES: ester cyclase [unclassified Pseudoalteromonas]NMR24051.1 polyketide cyclase [Pseudoalteromonas sp. NEC-BIFX-2020_015]NNG43128.1 polyketide cyclase [Pseudoalteromonas sp. NEC-BIFX-2020_002]
MSTHNKNKELIKEFTDSLYNFDINTLKTKVTNLFAEDALIQLCHPFETLANPNALIEQVYTPLADAFIGLERRDTIVMAGSSLNESDWVGCCGYYTGSFEKSWLGIPPTGHQVSMRFHEFYRIKNNKVVETQVIWDIPEVMIQANVWPLSPSLGKEWHVPGPATQDGLINTPYNLAQATRSLNVVGNMCHHLGFYAQGGIPAMKLEQFWHPHCSWYGPSTIGTARGIKGFRNWHQIPFLNALPNRIGDASKGYLFGDSNYVGFTAWPGMNMTISHDGWLGIAPANQKITMRSLDFWRIENNLIRENWVLIDILDVYHQINVNVFARMKELAKARYLNFAP